MDYFRFTSIHFDYVPTRRERPVELWLTVESYLPSTLYVGAILTLAVEPISLVDRPGVAEFFTGARVKVTDIIGRRIAVQWLTKEGARRAEGLDVPTDPPPVERPRFVVLRAGIFRRQGKHAQPFWLHNVGSTYPASTTTRVSIATFYAVETLKNVIFCFSCDLFFYKY